MDVLADMRADAPKRLQRAMARRDRDDFEKAVRLIVETTVPRPTTPNDRIRWRRRGDAHMAWRWVVADGAITLVVSTDYRNLTTELWRTRGQAGVGGQRLEFRDVTADIDVFVQGLRRLC